MAGTVRKRSWVTRKGETKTAWTADYFDQNRKRHTRQFVTRKAADAWLLRARGEVRDGTHTPDASSITVAEAAVVWLKRGEDESLERATLRGYRGCIETHIVPSIGAVKLSRLTTPRVVEFRDELLRTRTRNTAALALTVLKMIVREMQRRGLTAQNVAHPVRITAKARDRTVLAIGRDVPSKDEVRRLLAAVSPRWKPWFLTAVLTGMRASELRGLTWECVDFDRQVIEVRQRADRWGTLGRPKTAAGTRTIPMAKELADCLREWRLACPRVEQARESRRTMARRLAPILGRRVDAVRNALARYGDDAAFVVRRYRARAKGAEIMRDSAGVPLPAPTAPGRLWLVFPTNSGTVLQHANLDAQVWRPLQVDAGVVTAEGKAKYGLHKLRHFFASWAIEQQFDAKRLQEILGHSSITMTFDRYGHWFPKPCDDQARMAAGARVLLDGSA